MTDPGQLKMAFHAAHAYHPDVIVEEYVKGGDFRLLVINGNFIAAAKENQPMSLVMGDPPSMI